MTGESANIRVNITPNTGPLMVVETMIGNIIAIIDEMHYLRAIKNASGKIVQVQPRFNNRVSLLQRRDVQRYRLIFDEVVPNHPPSQH